MRSPMDLFYHCGIMALKVIEGKRYCETGEEASS
jgi:hypothetical protein